MAGKVENDIAWILEIILIASERNASSDENNDWRGISMAAQLCMHKLADGCGFGSCECFDDDILMNFVSKYT